MRLGVEVYVGSEFDIILWLAQSLKEIGSAVGDGVSSLEEIAIHLDCATFQEDEEVHVFELRSGVWKDVDTLLTTSEKFSNLRKFDLYICCPPDPVVLQKELGVESIEQLFCGYMPWLFKSGLLHVQPTMLNLQRIVTRISH